MAANQSLKLKRSPARKILPDEFSEPVQKPRTVKRDYKEELRDQLRVTGIPDPDTEFRFHPVRKWRFDFCWPDKKIAVEYQGGIYSQGKQGHQTTSGISRDCVKFSTAASMGWRLLPINAGMVRDGTALDLIRKALAL